MTRTEIRAEPTRARSLSLRKGPRKGPPEPKAAKSRRRREALTGYLFLAPWFIGLAAITAGPLVASLYLSFTDYNLIGDANWVGLDNYERMFTDDPRYMKALRNTAVYVFVSVPLQLGFALGLALLLDRGVSGLPIYRSIYYLPSLLGGSVAIAILWRQIFGDDGIVNGFLGIFGVEGTSWIADPDTALGTLIILNVWTFGAPMVIFLAGLRQIPHSLYEAAGIDGANKLRQFRSITLPLLTPIIFFNLVLQLINAFQSFTQAFVVSGGKGGPADSTLFYTMYIYLKGFGPSLEMGYASAMAWVLVLIIATFTAINFGMSKYWVFYSDK
ncbi:MULTISPECIES: sugar ABC transporter permease [unclassified Streptomyces]|uniref:Sugar ABC transporter permease n=1 Tax=Streptomyces johnsoniae TaxID=3075532 RepID=A0ABU2SCL4_9ACTN|nr:MULTISPECIES: sugar ABC transporter permease [unclassified Streptomyces]MDT0446712.1 sugar ABC transporter permease [Streptomyces sp. DSM 41886]ONK14192.1 Lactose transport system permease protein LacF [Streptomyces sp. MP131-18]